MAIKSRGFTAGSSHRRPAAAACRPLQLTTTWIGADLAPLISAEIELSVFDHTGALLQTLTGLSNTGGQVTFNVPILPGEIEYIATSGSLSSNAISVTGVTGASPGLTTGLP